MPPIARLPLATVSSLVSLRFPRVDMGVRRMMRWAMRAQAARTSGRRPTAASSAAAETLEDRTLLSGFDPATIGGRVVTDTDLPAEDHRVGEYDVGAADVRVRLFEIGADGLARTADDRLVDAGVTDADGYYQLTADVAGTYFVQILNDRWERWADPEVGDESGDSDIDAAGLSDLLALAGGEQVTIDAVGQQPYEGLATRGITDGIGWGQGQFGNVRGIQISGDGRYATFISASPHYVDGDRNGDSDAFLVEIATGAVTRVSTRFDGDELTRPQVYLSRITDDGRFVMFTTQANDVVAGSDGGVFVFDRLSGSSEQVSFRFDRTPQTYATGLDISGDGRYVLYQSSQTDHTNATLPSGNRLYVYDRLLEQTEMVSLAADGSIATGEHATISGDGRYVLFESDESLVADDANGLTDLYVRDRVAGTTERVAAGTDAGPDSRAPQHATISDDGRYVAFYAWNSTLPPAGQSRGSVYLTDRQTGQITPVAVAPNGQQQSAYDPAISGDGSTIVFHSYSDDLVPGDTGLADIFAYDTATATFERVSEAPDGSAGNRSAEQSASVSDDGRQVAFVSYATNLVSGLTDGSRNAFVRDRDAGTTNWIDRTDPSAGIHSETGDHKAGRVLDGSGRYVAFVSGSPRLVDDDDNGVRDVFVRDLLTGETEMISRLPDGTPFDGASIDPQITADGRFVVFLSIARNAAGGENTYGQWQTYLADRQTGQIEVVSVGANGELARSQTADPSVDATGRFVVFSTSNALVAADTNGRADVYVRDRVAGTTALVSVALDGFAGEDSSNAAQISEDGRFVVFSSRSNNLVAGDIGQIDLFVRDLVAGTTERINLTPSGAASSASAFDPAISADGRYVAFLSHATDLVAGVSGSVSRVYVRDRLLGRTELVSQTTGGTAAAAYSADPAISADGRRVAFVSNASLAFGGSGGNNVYLRDLDAGTTTLVSRELPKPGSALNARVYADAVSISRDGRFVAFETSGGLVVPGPASRGETLFVTDTLGNAPPQITQSVYGIDDTGEPGSALTQIVADPGEADQSVTLELVGQSHFSGGVGDEGIDYFTLDADGTVRLADGLRLMPGSYLLEVRVRDSGFGLQSEQRFVRIDVAAVAPRPTVDRLSAARYVENRNPVFFARSARLLDAGAADFSGGTVRVFIPDAAAEDRIGLLDGRGVVVDAAGFGLGSGVVRYATSGVGLVEVADLTHAEGELTLAFRDGVSHAIATQVLRRLAYENTSDDPAFATRAIRFELRNAELFRSLPADVGSASIDLVAVADAATLTGIAASAAFVENGGPVALAAAVQVSDVDTTDFGGARLDLVNRRFRQRDDRLVFDPSGDAGIALSGPGGGTAPGATVSIDGRAVAMLARGTSGNRMTVDFLAGATADDVARIAVGMRFDSDADLLTGPKQIAWTLTDSGGGRGSAVTTVEVTNVNDRPEILNVDGTHRTVAIGLPPQRLATSAAVFDADRTAGPATLSVGVFVSDEYIPFYVGVGVDLATDPAGRVVRSGDDILYEGTLVGTVTVDGGETLAIAFNAQASVAAIRSVARLMAVTTESWAQAGDYSVLWSFDDGSGEANSDATAEMGLTLTGGGPGLAASGSAAQAVALLDAAMSQAALAEDDPLYSGIG